jgi:uncharacterized protein YndB with AHSA1/START domain
MTAQTGKAAKSASLAGSTESDVVVRVQIAAEPATVWSFLSDGAKFASWIGAYGGGPPLPGTRVSPGVGGSVRVEYPGGQFGAGEVLEAEPPRRIVFTWGYEGGSQGMAPGSTRIEIVLTPVAAGTQVELRHSGIPTEDARRGHKGGWTHYLSMLAREGSAAQHADRCCEPDVRVRTRYACTNGVRELSGHIAGALVHMPGVRLKQSGPAQLLHGFACAPWAACSADGKELMRGRNHIALSPSSRVELVVSFGD